MRSMRLPDFNPVAPGATASLKIPKWALTLLGFSLRFGGTTMTKALINRVSLKLGTRTIWQVVTFGSVAGGTILDRVNRSLNIFDDANRLSCWLYDRNMESGPLKDIGGIDMTKVSDDLFLEVDIAPGASAPTMYANAYFTGPQGATPEDPNGQLITKLISLPYSFASGGRFLLPFEPKGALVKRAFLQFTGSNGTTTTNGNVSRFEVRKNGSPMWEHDDQENRFALQEIGKRVPINNQYLVDMTLENNLSGALVTADAQSLEFAPTFTAADSGVCLFECLDAPYNLGN
jgi:hypothetical protein